jgi:hypothetical protein
MGVDRVSHRFVGVTHATAEDLAVDAVVAGEREVGVPDVVQLDPRHAGPVDEPVEVIVIVSGCRRLPFVQTMSLPWIG